MAPEGILDLDGVDFEAGHFDQKLAATSNGDATFFVERGKIAAAEPTLLESICIDGGPIKVTLHQRGRPYLKLAHSVAKRGIDRCDSHLRITGRPANGGPAGVGVWSIVLGHKDCLGRAIGLTQGNAELI